MNPMWRNVLAMQVYIYNAPWYPPWYNYLYGLQLYFLFFATVMLVFLESNLTGFQMDWTLLSFLNEVCVLASTSSFEYVVCMCIAQKNEMQNKNLRVKMQCKKWCFCYFRNGMACYFQKQSRPTCFFNLKNSILKTCHLLKSVI